MFKKEQYDKTRKRRCYCNSLEVVRNTKTRERNVFKRYENWKKSFAHPLWQKLEYRERRKYVMPVIYKKMKMKYAYVLIKTKQKVLSSTLDTGDSSRSVGSLALLTRGSCQVDGTFGMFRYFSRNPSPHQNEIKWNNPPGFFKAQILHMPAVYVKLKWMHWTQHLRNIVLRTTVSHENKERWGQASRCMGVQSEKWAM